MAQTSAPSLEGQIAETNADFFLREFSFSQTEIKVPNRTQVELADHVIFIDNVIVIFQLKERNEETTESKKEISWYQSKILNKAVKQIKDTISYLQKEKISLTNDRGHTIDLPQGLTGCRVLKIIVYSPGQKLPEIIMRQKVYVSSSVGFIHLLRLEDYRRLLFSLVTLPEIIEYFEYREKLCLAFPSEAKILPEQALVGHYIRGDLSMSPTASDAERLASLGNSESFDISGILQKFKDKTHATKVEPGLPSQSDYYKILKEVLYLNRSGLEQFKNRFMWAWDNCGIEIKVPTRFMVPDRGCGFIFIPIPNGEEYRSELILNNLTILGKYESRYSRYLGIAFKKDGEFRLLDWMYCEGEWKEDPEKEALLKKIPFLPLRQATIPRY